MARSAERTRDDERLLVVWTPRLLRVALVLAATLLVAGLAVVSLTAPETYVEAFRALGRGGAAAIAANPGHAPPRLQGIGATLLVSGLFVLTFVPIGRVTFSLFVFVRGRDWTFVFLTAAVLALLGLGVLLGHLG